MLKVAGEDTKTPDKRSGRGSRLTKHFRTFVVSLLLPAAAVGAVRQDRFTLGRFIPGDSWLYVHKAHNPERDWLDKEWTEFFDALKASGIDRDISSLVFSMLGDEAQSEARATVEKWTGLIDDVEWHDLIGEEVAFAERIVKRESRPAYEYFLLMRGKTGTAERNVKALAKLLTEIAALKEEITVSTRSLNGASVWSLSFGEADGKSPPLSLELFRKGDVIGLTSGRAALEAVTALMSGKSTELSISKAPRFVEAMKQVDAPEDKLMFFDMKAFLRDLSEMMSGVVEEGGGADDESGKDAGRIISAISKLIGRCDVIDYVVATTEMRGRRELTHEVARLQASKRKCTVACCFVDRKPFQRFDRFVPADATGFKLCASVDLEGLYKLATEFVGQDLPGGAGYLDAWNGMLASVGFDPHEDLFSWWSGEMIRITLPAAAVTLMGGSDGVVMFRVKDAERATAKVNSAIGALRGMLQAHGQMLMVSPADVEAEGFQQVTHPMVAMMMRPVVGVKGDWLMLGSSADAINRCLRVAAGDAPSITQSERFKEEGLSPQGPVMSASFTDTSQFGQELGQMVAMFGMVGGIATAGIGQDGEGGDETKKIIQKLMGTIMKLGPVLQKLDFYSSEASVTTYDGKLSLRTEKVITYKSPTPGKVKRADAK